MKHILLHCKNYETCGNDVERTKFTSQPCCFECKKKRKLDAHHKHRTEGTQKRKWHQNHPTKEAFRFTKISPKVKVFYPHN